MGVVANYTQWGYSVENEFRIAYFPMNLNKKGPFIHGVKDNKILNLVPYNKIIEEIVSLELPKDIKK